MHPVPITILGGRSGSPGDLPADGLHPLPNYKAAAIQVDDRPLIAHVVERCRQVEGFGPVTIAGPSRIYAPLGLDAEIIETDGTVAENLRATIERHGTDGPIAILASDVLLSVAELSELRGRFEADSPCALWCPFVRAPEDSATLGAFGWKPRYRIAPEDTGQPVAILPGHLCIFVPQRTRLSLLYRLLDLAYETRNRSVRHRRGVMLRKLALSLLWRDVVNLTKLRAPSSTVRVVGSGLRLAKQLRAGSIRGSELEHLIGRIFREQGVTGAEGRYRYPIVDILNLAKDVDTIEEAREFSTGAPTAVSGS